MKVLVIGSGGRELQESVDVVGRHRDVAHTRLARGAGVAGRHEDLVDARRSSAAPGEGVFAATAADDEDTHGASAGSGACR